MFLLFGWAETIMKTLIEVGDILMYRPFEWAEDFFKFFEGMFDWYGLDMVGDIFGLLGAGSIGSILFGAGISTLITIKVVNFFTDIIN